ncbi:MAG: hypothetical protein IT165_00835 [Bryobacterales bacterium]|nr:hypothetical protein [Bryobacterales bacterium]
MTIEQEMVSFAVPGRSPFAQIRSVFNQLSRLRTAGKQRVRITAIHALLRVCKQFPLPQLVHIMRLGSLA